MCSSRPADVGKAGIENLTERLRGHYVSRPGTKTLYAGTVVMPYYVGLKALGIRIIVRVLFVKHAPAPHL